MPWLIFTPCRVYSDKKVNLMRVTIISSCTGAKKHKPENQLTQDDFRLIGTDTFLKREKELSDFRLPARDMYTGQQHVRLLRGLDLIRKSCPDLRVDLNIISAGYGVINESTPIVPYEMTFNGLKVKELRSWADFLKVPEGILSAIKGYNLSIFLLGKEYLRAVNFPSELAGEVNCVFFTGKGSQRYLPSGHGVKTVFLSNQDARRLGAGLVALKGRVLEILGEHVDNDPSFLETIVGSPERLVDFVKGYEKPMIAKMQSKPKKDPDAQLKADYDARVIKLTSEWKGRPHRKKMRYFIPEWDDLVNPLYDFETDTHPEGTGDGYEFAHYAHQIYDSPKYDGILISKVIVEGKKSKKAILEKLGVHRYLRVPREFPIMGDCGAFGYILEDVPPYQTKEILDYYQRFDFDYGVSIDHLIVKGVLKKDIYYLIGKDGSQQEITKDEFDTHQKSGIEEIKSIRRQLELFKDGPFLFKKETIDKNERDRRYELTINNAKGFIEGHRQGRYRFVPVGAVQGWSPESYADAVKAYQEMGYTYIALGGLVRTPTKGILEVLREVKKILKSGVDLHLFGVARPDAFKEMNRLGVTSVDSATFLRRAWLGASANYFTSGEKYAAIRIPQAEKSPRAKKMVREGKISLEEVKILEEKCLRLLRAYDKKQADFEDVFKAVMTYDDLMGGNRNGHDILIRKTLKDRPWESCECKICQEHGVEVIIFRGNNRNRRRGFHNTKIFYDQLCKMFGDR